MLKLQSKPLTNERRKPDKLTVGREKPEVPSKEDVSKKGCREILRKIDGVSDMFVKSG